MDCILKTSDQTLKTRSVWWTGLPVNVLHSWDHARSAWKHQVAELIHPSAAASVLPSTITLLNEIRRVKKTKQNRSYKINFYRVPEKPLLLLQSKKADNLVLSFENEKQSGGSAVTLQEDDLFL